MNYRPYIISAIRSLHANKDAVARWSMTGTGDGTYIKLTSSRGRWGYVKLEFQHADRTLSEPAGQPWSIVFSPSLDTFPEAFKTEINDTLVLLEPVIRVLTGRGGSIEIHVLDAEYHSFDSHRGSFAFAVVHALKNAIHPDLHTPDLAKVERYRNDYKKRAGIGQ